MRNEPQVDGTGIYRRVWWEAILLELISPAWIGIVSGNTWLGPILFRELTTLPPVRRKDFFVWAVNKNFYVHDATNIMVQAVVFDVTLTVRSLPPCFVRLGVSSWTT
jgi:hypothetical protein